MVWLKIWKHDINPFLIHQSALEYLLIGAYTVGNAGIYQVTPQNGTPVGRDEIDYLVKNQRNKAEIYQGRLERYLCKVHFDEYKIDSDNIVNPKKQGYGGISFLWEKSEKQTKRLLRN